MEKCCCTNLSLLLSHLPPSLIASTLIYQKKSNHLYFVYLWLTRAGMILSLSKYLKPWTIRSVWATSTRKTNTCTSWMGGCCVFYMKTRRPIFMIKIATSSGCSVALFAIIVSYICQAPEILFQFHLISIQLSFLVKHLTKFFNATSSSMLHNKMDQNPISWTLPLFFWAYLDHWIPIYCSWFVCHGAPHVGNLH